MAEACDEAMAFAAGRTLDDFLSDRLLRAAIERKMSIIGEALFQARRFDPEWHRLVTDARDIVRMRHLLVHGYQQVDPQRIWQIVCHHLPLLRQELAVLLENPGGCAGSEDGLNGLRGQRH